MKFCDNCGKAYDDNLSSCPYCAEEPVVTIEPTIEENAQQTYQQAAPQQQYGGQQYAGAAAPVVDNGGFGWGLLGFCIPIVGLVLYLVWKDQKPVTAKAAGIGALVSVGISVVLWLISAVIGIGAAMMY